MQIRTKAAIFFKRVLCKFGMKEELSLCCTIGANEKGGMDKVEFAKYVSIVLRKLYPDAAPEKGKWVILKCDGGPGRMNVNLLASLWLDGFRLFPGVPNTTAVTQETDQNYGPFKRAYARNLDMIVDERIAQGKTTSIPAWLVGLAVFGGTDPETKLELPVSAFHIGFSEEACKHAWEKVGAAPLTRACLNDKRVRRSIGDSSEEEQVMDRLIQEANDVATFTLTMCVYNGTVLAQQIKPHEEMKQLTEEHSLEHQLLLKNATTHGKKITVLGGQPLTTDDMFIGTEYRMREKEKQGLTVTKTKRLRMMALEVKSVEILAKREAAPDNEWTATDLKTLLSLHKVTKLDKMNKEDKIRRWEDICRQGLHPPTIERWTDDIDNALQQASRLDMDVGDTALGRLAEQRKKESRSKRLDYSSRIWQLNQTTMERLVT
jgi:hypothetical protein